MNKTTKYFLVVSAVFVLVASVFGINLARAASGYIHYSFINIYDKVGDWTVYSSYAKVLMTGKNLESAVVKACSAGAETEICPSIGNMTKYGISSQGEDQWSLNLPTNLLATNLWVEAIDTEGNTIKGENFGKVGYKNPDLKPQLKLISPNGGEVWVVGKTYDIKWSSNVGKRISVTLHRYDKSSKKPSLPEFMVVHGDCDNFDVGMVYKTLSLENSTSGCHIIIPETFVFAESDIPLVNENIIYKIRVSYSDTVMDESDDFFTIVSAQATPTPQKTITPSPTPTPSTTPSAEPTSGRFEMMKNQFKAIQQKFVELLTGFINLFRR